MANSLTLETSLDTDRLVRRGMAYQWLTIGHGLLETAVALGAGVAAGSIVLFGFGLDSLIEVCSAFIVIWRLMVQHNAAKRSVVDSYGVRFVGVGFVVLATYVLYDSCHGLFGHELPHESVPGIVLAAFSVVAMPLLARAKRKLAAEIKSGAMGADSVQSEICGYLSGILLVGLGLNWLFGWWWADPVSALFMVPIIAREGILALQGKACGCACAIS